MNFTLLHFLRCITCQATIENQLLMQHHALSLLSNLNITLIKIIYRDLNQLLKSFECSYIVHHNILQYAVCMKVFSVSDDKERDFVKLAFRASLRQCGTPRIPCISFFRAQPTDGCDRGWNPGLLFTDCPPLTAVLLLPLSTQRRPQVSDR